MFGGYTGVFIKVHQGKWLRWLAWLCLVVLMWLCLPATTPHAQAGAAISQGFQTSEKNMTVGALVSLEAQNQGHVQFANTARAQNLVGVVGERSLIALSTGGSQVQVVTSGVTQALVSNINGPISTGDKITASPIDGVGMRASKSTQIVGTAQADFKDVKTAELTVTDRSGKPQVVRTGVVPVQVNVTYYAVPETQSKTFLPAFLQQIANSVAGREVAAVRVLVGMLVLLLGFVSSGILLYSSVQSSIISIGRNPLSKDAVHKSLLQVGVMAVGILLVMIIAIYLILMV